MRRLVTHITNSRDVLPVGLTYAVITMRSEDSLGTLANSTTLQNWAQGLSVADNSATIFHSNRYNAQAACKHCEGVIRHEPWCITLHPSIYYAYQIVADPSKLTVGDALILHSRGDLGSECLPG